MEEEEEENEEKKGGRVFFLGCGFTFGFFFLDFHHYLKGGF